MSGSGIESLQDGNTSLYRSKHIPGPKNDRLGAYPGYGLSN